MLRSPASLRVLFWLGLASAATGAALNWASNLDLDPSFRAAIADPAGTDSSGRAIGVLIDEGHQNLHTASGGYAPLSRILRADGFWVRRSDSRFGPEAFRSARVLIVANALGWSGTVQQLANRLGFEGWFDLTQPAFEPAEIRFLADWVAAGNGLLLVADHAPCGAAARDLSTAFGVSLSNSYTEDAEPSHHAFHSPLTLVFNRENGLLGEHPITRGRRPAEQVDRVVTFTGESLRGPGHASVLLKLGDQARDYPRRNARNSEGKPARGLAQGIAFAFGNGRVVVLGEAAGLTSARVQDGAVETHMGIGDRSYDNAEFALNVVRWLAGVL